GLAVSPRNPDRLALTDLGFIHVSDDGGATWRQAYVQPQYANPAGADTPPSRAYATSGVEQTATWWLTFVDRQTLFASVSDIRSERSTDGGLTWSRNGRDGLNFNANYRSVVRASTGALYAAVSSVHDLYESTYLREARIDGTASSPTRGGVMVSSDKGAHFTMLYDFHHPVVWVTLDPKHTNLLYASVVNSTD